MIINHKSGKGGAVGKDGTTPHIGANGNWFLGETDTGVLAKAQGNTEIAEITLLASNWDESLNQTVACEGISKNEADQMVTLLPSLSSKEGYSRCRISCTAFAENSLTFTAESLPTEDITVFVAMEGESAAIANNVYSLEETVVGTWIDGKPIYRKMYTGTPTYGLKLTNSGDIDALVDCGGFYCGIDGKKYIIPHMYHDDVVTLHIETDGNIAFWVGGTAPVYVVTWVEYTKTTDTATVAIPSATALAEAYEEGVNEA